VIKTHSCDDKEEEEAPNVLAALDNYAESEDDSETRIQTHKARERSMARYRNRQKHIHNLMSGMPGRETSETEQLQEKITAL